MMGVVTKPDEVTANNMLVLAREDLACYCVAQWPHFQLADHHRLVIDKLETVERGDVRLLVEKGNHYRQL